MSQERRNDQNKEQASYIAEPDNKKQSIDTTVGLNLHLGTTEPLDQGRSSHDLAVTGHVEMAQSTSLHLHQTQPESVVHSVHHNEERRPETPQRKRSLQVEATAEEQRTYGTSSTAKRFRIPAEMTTTRVQPQQKVLIQPDIRQKVEETDDQSNVTGHQAAGERKRCHAGENSESNISTIKTSPANKRSRGLLEQFEGTQHSVGRRTLTPLPQPHAQSQQVFMNPRIQSAGQGRTYDLAQNPQFPSQQTSRENYGQAQRMAMTAAMQSAGQGGYYIPAANQQGPPQQTFPKNYGQAQRMAMISAMQSAGQGGNYTPVPNPQGPPQQTPLKNYGQTQPIAMIAAMQSAGQGGNYTPAPNPQGPPQQTPQGYYGQVQRVQMNAGMPTAGQGGYNIPASNTQGQSQQMPQGNYGHVRRMPMNAGVLTANQSGYYISAPNLQGPAQQTPQGYYGQVLRMPVNSGVPAARQGEYFTPAPNPQGRSQQTPQGYYGQPQRMSMNAGMSVTSQGRHYTRAPNPQGPSHQMNIQRSGQVQQMPTIARMPTASEGGDPMVGQRRQIPPQQIPPQQFAKDQRLPAGNVMQAAAQGGYYVPARNPQVQNQQMNFEQYRQLQGTPFDCRTPIIPRNLQLQFPAHQQAVTQQLAQRNHMPMNLKAPTSRSQISTQQDPQLQEQHSKNQRVEQESISNISQHQREQPGAAQKSRQNNVSLQQRMDRKRCLPQAEEFMEDRGIETQSTSKRPRIPVDKATVKKGDMPVKPINEDDTDDLNDEQFADLFRPFGKLMDIAKRAKKLELEKKKREEKSKKNPFDDDSGPFEYPCSPEIQQQTLDSRMDRRPSAFGLTKDEANEERMNMSTESRLHFDFVDELLGYRG